MRKINLTHRLWAGVIVQALRDYVDDLPNQAYDEDEPKHRYSGQEAKRWLETEGVRLMVTMGIPINRIRMGLDNPRELLRNLQMHHT